MSSRSPSSPCWTPQPATTTVRSDDQFLADALAELERVTRNALAAPDEQLTIRLERALLVAPPKVVTTWSLTGDWSSRPART